LKDNDLRLALTFCLTATVQLQAVINDGYCPAGGYGIVSRACCRLMYLGFNAVRLIHDSIVLSIIYHSWRGYDDGKLQTRMGNYPDWGVRAKKEYCFYLKGANPFLLWGIHATIYINWKLFLL